MDSLRVGVVGYSGQKFDVDQARMFVVRAFDTIKDKYPHHQITVVSGLTNLGIPKIAYAEAVGRGWRTAGVACEKAAEYDCFPVDDVHIEGANWGDESPAFVNGIDMIIRVGGGEQSHAETRAVKAQGKPVFEYDLPPLAS